MRVLLAAGIAVVGLSGGAPAAAQPRVSCDRACLTNMLDRYVDALLARAPAQLPLATTVRFTENGHRLALGDGLWNTVSGKGRYRLDMTDVEAGQAILMGTVREADTPTIFVLRLGVVQERMRNGTLADGRKVVSGPSIPWTWQIAEFFKIEKGLIGPVESVLHQVPYGMDPGWSTWEDAMSSRPRW
jgi:hypothetical protein